MAPILYSEYRPIPPLAPNEIQHLRKALGWSQTKMGQFFGRDGGTVQRWEAGRYDPEPAHNGVLYQLWIEVFGSYDGPYQFPTAEKPERADESLKLLAKALLIGGAAYFIVKGLALLDESKREAQ